MTPTLIRRFVHATVLGAMLAIASSLSAQTVLNSTTLSAAVTDSGATTLTVASTTGITAPGTGTNIVFLLIDREILQVRTVNTTTGVLGVIRGQNGTRATTHNNSAVVWVAPPQAILNYIPSGQCQRTLLLYVPAVVGGGTGLGAETGDLFDCLGVTTAGQWVQTAPTLGNTFVGTTVASAGTITATGTYFAVSGTAAIATINVPAGWQGGNCLILEPTGIFTTTTAGNISLASTAVVGKALTECWNNLTSKWQPSY